MAKKTMRQDQYDKIVREAEDVSQVLKMPGWKVIRDDIKKQMKQIERLLAENRLRTVQETVELKDGTKTFTTTAETQIAENAGMYKMGKCMLDLVQTITQAPKKIEQLRQQGLLAIEGEERREVSDDGR